MLACQEPTNETKEKKPLNENKVDQDSGESTSSESPYTGIEKL